MYMWEHNQHFYSNNICIWGISVLFSIQHITFLSRKSMPSQFVSTWNYWQKQQDDLFPMNNKTYEHVGICDQAQ